LVVEFAPLPISVGFQAADEAGGDSSDGWRTASDDTGDAGVLLDLPRRLRHLLERDRHLDVVLVEDVFAIGEDVTLLEHRDRVERPFADAPTGLAVPAIGANEGRVEVLDLEPLAIGQLRIVQEVVERQDPIWRHILPIAHWTGHNDRELAPLLREVRDQFRKILILWQDQIFDVDARELPELRNQRQ